MSRLKTGLQVEISQSQVEVQVGQSWVEVGQIWFPSQEESLFSQYSLLFP